VRMNSRTGSSDVVMIASNREVSSGGSRRPRTPYDAIPSSRRHRGAWWLRGLLARLRPRVPPLRDAREDCTGTRLAAFGVRRPSILLYGMLHCGVREVAFVERAT